ncbi:MAG: GAF domain-containing protein, partial [bacterium]|nr:GAF domain-containing protein [bacterium]
TLENAGAEKGCLLLEKEGKIFVEAEGEVGNSGVRVLESVPVELHRGLSSAMVNYVERTKEPLILADASGEGEYTHDPYVLEQKPKSILCMPIVRQGKLTGMLYLENDLISGAFTPERLEVLKVISSQVAISIDNARLYENLEQKNEKLIELDKLKDEFLANTSHELRTPLNGIIGIADSMLEHDDFDEKSGRDLSLIVSSGRRLANLVNDILDFSKLKNRDIGLNPVPLDIKSLTDVVIDLSRPLTRQKGLELVNAIDAGIPAVNGDENRLQQILFNLVGNSIKFTESGEVRITADILEAGNAKDRFIRITVSDTGIGIPPGKQDDVFKSFEQVDGSIARQYGGTGIGLSIVKQLVELHGGEVGLVSAEGAGSSFFFTIPAAEGKARQENISRSIEQASRVRDLSVEEAASAGEREGGKKSGRKGGRILAVDDDLVNLQVINNYLSTGDSTADYDL